MKPDKVKEFVRKNIICVICGGIILILAAIYYLRSDIKPAAEKIAEDKETESARLGTNIENSTDLQVQVDSLQEQNKAIEARLVHSGQLAEYLQYFYRLESDTHTHLADIQVPPGPKTPKGGALYVPVVISLNVEGNYLTLLDFLKRVEKGEHFSRVDGCTLKPTNASERAGAMTLNLQLELLGLP